MAEPISTLKGTRKKKDITVSRSFYGATPLSEENSGRLSLMSNVRLQKIKSNSLEKLSFISEKEGCDNSDFENYHLIYSRYLLSKVQNRLLTKNKSEKEENVKKCFVSLKLELEGLLERFVELSKGIGYYKTYMEIIKDCKDKIEVGENILKVLKENEFETRLKSLSSSLDRTINQLELVDIDKSVIEEAVRRKVWGLGSEIDECLKKINFCTSKNKTLVSNIAMELAEIKKLSYQNFELRERFCSLFHILSAEVLETNYTIFMDVVRKAYKKRQELNGGPASPNQEFDIPEFLLFGVKPLNMLSQQQSTLQISNFDSSYYQRPNSASTPQPP